MALNKPVLLLCFNRPETTEKLFQEIKKVRPSKLYISCDGPRKNNFIDKKRVKKVREVVSKVDWPCKVYKLFRKDNLGLRKGIPDSINWFFNHEDSGIILEDDCILVPNFQEEFEKSYTALPVTWEVAYLGYCRTEEHPKIKINDRITIIQYPLCTHAILYKRNVLLTFIERIGFISEPVDVLWAWRVLPHTRCFCFDPNHSFNNSNWEACWADSCNANPAKPLLNSFVDSPCPWNSPKAPW